MIPFIDLKKQYSLIENDVLAGIKRVLDSGHYILGSEVAELEKQLAEYAGTKYALACSSGTDLPVRLTRSAAQLLADLRRQAK